MSEERTSKYWICDKCAKKKKLTPPKWAVTGIYGLCGWCRSRKEQALIPVCDYGDPKTGRKPVWD